MGKVVTEFTMSLDGFIAGSNDDVGNLFKWYMSGDTEFTLPTMDRTFKISKASADLLTRQWKQLGAQVTGRRDFDVSNAWGGQALLGVPIFIVTHNPPAEWVYEGSPFQFVTAGVAEALDLAQSAAGDKIVGVGGSIIVQQCLQAGLLDEIHLHLAPVLLGDGIRLFDHLGNAPIELENIWTIHTPDVTHLAYHVVK